MNRRAEVTGSLDPLVTAAIIAAVARLEEERAALAALPPRGPSQGRWVLSGRPREVAPPITRPSPSGIGEWGVGSDDESPET